MEELIPKLLLGSELKQALQILPKYDSKIRNAQASERLIALTHFYDIFYPSKMACEIYSKLYFAYLNAIKKKSSKQPKTSRGILGESDTFSIIGSSGIGKSTAISRAISIISQDDIVNINNSKVIPFLVVQTPSDASIKGLLLEILRLVDEQLGTRYHNDAIRSRATLDMLVSLSSKVFFNHIGVLVLDEIQNLVGSKNGNNLVKAIVQLVNVSSISICFVGTPEAISFFELEFHLARRSIGLSYSGFENDSSFEDLCHTLFKYQYTKNYTPLTRDIIDWLYIHSQGILSVVVGLIYSSQQIAILEEIESLNLETLSKAFNQRFEMLHYHLNLPNTPQRYSNNSNQEPFITLNSTDKKPAHSFSLVEVIEDAKQQQNAPIACLKAYISIEEIAI